MTHKSRLTRRTALRAASLALFVFAWLMVLGTSELEEGYYRDITDEQGSVGVEIDDVGYCLPKVLLDRPVSEITIYLDDKEIAWASCEEGGDSLTGFYYDSAGNCDVSSTFTTGTDTDGRDAGAVGGDGGSGPGDGGPGPDDAGADGLKIFVTPCYCSRDDSYAQGDEKSPTCEGTFRIELTTTDGETSSITYEQSWEDTSTSYDCG